MSISTFDDLIASAKQVVSITRFGTRTVVAGQAWFTTRDVYGQPWVSGLAVGNTANGVVPNDATAGYPRITFSSGSGYLGGVWFGNTAAGAFMLYDRLFHAGAFAYNAGTATLSSQPSYSARVPLGTDYSNLQIWLEVSTAFASGNNWSAVVNYTNQAGVTGRATTSTGAIAAANLTLGRFWGPLQLQADDTGVQKIEGVVVTNGATVMTAGAFNVVVMKPLYTGRAFFSNDGSTWGIQRTMMPQVFPDSALEVALAMDSTSIGSAECYAVIVSN